MIKLKRYKGLAVVKYLYMLLLFLWCAYTAPFLKPFDSQYVLSSMLYIVIYALYYFKFCNNKNNSPLILLLSIMGLWYIVQIIKNGGIVGLDFRLIYSIVLCHVSFYLYKGREFYIYFEKVLVHLTLLSFVVWGMGIFFPKEAHAISDSLSVWNNGNTTYGNFIVVALGNQHSMGILRNTGFTWEAGRFSSFLVVGLFVSLLLHNMKIIGNKSFIIFAIGIITTVSTTGIGACVGPALLYFANNNKKINKKIIFLVIMVLILPHLWEMDFIGGKIMQFSDAQQEMSDMQWSFDHGREAITPQRITGIYLEWQNFLHDFWFGYNLNENAYCQSSLFKGYQVWLSDGLLQILSKYGIFIGIFFYYCLFKSSSKLVKDFSYEGKYTFALTFMLISISYDFWSSGIFLHMVLYWVYCKYVPAMSISYTRKKHLYAH